MVGNVSWGGDTLVEGVEHVEGSGKYRYVSNNIRMLSTFKSCQKCLSIYVFSQGAGGFFASSFCNRALRLRIITQSYYAKGFESALSTKHRLSCP